MSEAKTARRILFGFSGGALALLVGRRILKRSGVLARDKNKDKALLHVERTLLIMKPRADVYAAWRDFEKLPYFLRHVIDVDDLGDGRSHWKAQLFDDAGARRNGDAGVVEWDARIVEDRPGEVLSWRSVDEGAGAAVDVSGCVRFEGSDGDVGATMMRVELDYKPKKGGALARGIVRRAIDAEVKEDLRRFKMQIEAGEVPTTKGQPVGADRKGVLLVDAAGGQP